MTLKVSFPLLSSMTVFNPCAPCLVLEFQRCTRARPIPPQGLRAEAGWPFACQVSCPLLLCGGAVAWGSFSRSHLGGRRPLSLFEPWWQNVYQMPSCAQGTRTESFHSLMFWIHSTHYLTMNTNNSGKLRLPNPTDMLPGTSSSLAFSFSSSFFFF